RLAARALDAQRFDQAQLLLAEQVRLGRRSRIVFGLGRSGLGGGATGCVPAAPVVAAAPDQRAVAGPARVGFGRVAAGELGEPTVAQVAREHVAIGHEGHARALRIEYRPCGVDAGERSAVDDPSVLPRDLLHVDIADAAALALERVVGASA